MILETTPREKYYFSHFTDEKTEAQRLRNLTRATLQTEQMVLKSLDSSTFPTTATLFSSNEVSLTL